MTTSRETYGLPPRMPEPMTLDAETFARLRSMRPGPRAHELATLAHADFWRAFPVIGVSGSLSGTAQFTAWKRFGHIYRMAAVDAYFARLDGMEIAA